MKQAKVKADYRFEIVTAFGGREYVKTEWRLIPEEQEGSIAAHPFLEVQEVKVEKVEEPKSAKKE